MPEALSSQSLEFRRHFCPSGTAQSLFDFKHTTWKGNTKTPPWFFTGMRSTETSESTPCATLGQELLAHAIACTDCIYPTDRAEWWSSCGGHQHATAYFKLQPSHFMENVRIFSQCLHYLQDRDPSRGRIHFYFYFLDVKKQCLFCSWLILVSLSFYIITWRGADEK